MESPSGTPSTKLVLGGASAAIFASIAALVLVPATVRSIMSSQFLPHVYCYLYDKQLIALHMSADALIWLSYVAIALTLTYMVRRARREIPFSWLFLAFGTFIIACGFTHFMEIVVLWKPLYWLAGDVKLVTAERCHSVDDHQRVTLARLAYAVDELGVQEVLQHGEVLARHRQSRRHGVAAALDQVPRGNRGTHRAADIGARYGAQ